MSTIYGKVVAKEKDVPIKKRTGGTYQGYRLVYTDQEGAVKTLEKAIENFKYSPSLETQFDALEVGKDVVINLEKNAKGFLDVLGFSNDTLQSDLPENIPVGGTPTPRKETSPAAANKYVSTYETPEERKVKQRLIVRQAALNQSLTYFGDIVDDPESVMALAEKFEGWVYRGI